MDPGFRSPLIDFFRRGEVARDVRLLAATSKDLGAEVAADGVRLTWTPTSRNGTGQVVERIGLASDRTRSSMSRRWVTATGRSSLPLPILLRESSSSCPRVSSPISHLFPGI